MGTGSVVRLTRSVFLWWAVFLAGGVGSVALGVGQACAATTPEALIKEGLELRRAGRDSDALAKFEAAYNQSKTPRAAAQWGLCLQAVSRWSEADPLLAEALSATQDPWVKKNRQVIKDSQEAVKAHVGRIEVLGDPVGAVVTVAGRTVGNLPLPGAVTVNEGSVDVEVTANGYKRAVRTLTVGGASYQRVVMRLEPVGVEPTASSSALSASSEPSKTGALNISATPATSDEPRPITKNPWFWAGAGVVVIGVIAAAVVLSSGTEFPRVNEERSIP